MYKNKTGNNGSNPPAQDGTNWEFISTCQGSRAYVQEFAASESPVSSVTLTEGVCYNADFMTVAVDHTILDPSAYTLGINGTTITFAEPVQAGLTITVRWFTEMNLSNVYRQPLLSCFWSDHLIYELSYLCADSFSWQDGNVYSAVYNHLVNDFANAGSWQLETIAGHVIGFKLASDGHKIVDATNATLRALENIYNATGVAWYYILDVENHRFKLPRTKYAFSGWRGNVGDYIPESLPNITGANLVQANNTSGCFYGIQNASISTAAGTGTGYGTGFNASRSSSTYQNGAPVQQRGTQMYLYFYVGNYTPQAIEQTAGYAQTLTELKADKDLANSPYTTNRILEIPQDIKLELNSGTLTLKAGSKVYVPNGFEADGVTRKFDVKIIENDISTRFGIGRKECIVVVDNDNALQWGDAPAVGSGSSPFGGIYYNTSTNLIVSPAGWFNANASLPIGIITEGSDDVESIDQIFNGFGYIGSTVFILPGVKVQIPNGRNADGTCKSLITNITSVKTLTVNASWGTYDIFIVSSGGIGRWPDIVSGSAGTRYNAATNYYEVISEGKWISQLDCVFAKIKTDTTSPYKITSFKPYNVDSIVNSNASNFSQAGRSYLSGLGMPSSKYEDWTLGANGSSYTAPANGYLQLAAVKAVSLQIYNTTAGNYFKTAFDYSNSENYLAVTCEAHKGDVLQVHYGITTVRWFRFYYAEGEN